MKKQKVFAEALNQNPQFDESSWPSLCISSIRNRSSCWQGDAGGSFRVLNQLICMDLHWGSFAGPPNEHFAAEVPKMELLGGGMQMRAKGRGSRAWVLLIMICAITISAL